MLSIANLSSSSAALSYYEDDDYYEKGSAEHENASFWFGNGARYLGLNGAVDRQNFANILRGKLPDGSLLGQKKGDDIKHAVGIDMTFSAPKSVSILSEVLEEKEVFEIHQKAVKTALKYSENNFVETRLKQGEKVTKQKVDNIIAATFTHNSSRNLDPQLHTHCVIANMVKRQDEKWRSAWFGNIFENKKLLGAIYRLELASGLEKIGYEIERTYDDGRFEIKGVPQNIIDSFSSRSQEIKEALKEYDFKNAKTAADATLRTRQNKQELSREELSKSWNNILQNKGYDKSSLKQQLSDFNNARSQKEQKNKQETSFLEEKWQKFKEFLGFNDSKHIKDDFNNEKVRQDSSDKELARKSIQYAIDHLGEKQSVFAKKEIMINAIGYGIGKIKIDKLDKVFNEFIAKNIILQSKQKDHENLYTTQKALETEKSSILMMKKGRGKKDPLSKDDISGILAKTTLNRNQQKAANFILSTKDQIVAIQGYAGVGKTYTLNIIRQIAKNNGHEFIGMAPSASAALTLQNEAKIPSQTVHKFLFKYEGLIHDRATKQGLKSMKNSMKNKVIILDEASLSSTNQVNSLLKVVKKLDMRLIMVGDIKQLDAVEAGRPFHQLQKYGMKTVIMDKIIRQKDQNLKTAVEFVTKGEVRQAFARFSDEGGQKSNQIIEEKSPTKIAQKAVDEYFKLGRGERKNSLILTQANETRAQINNLVRKKLKNDNYLGKESIVLENLKQKDLSNIQKKDARNYKIGEVVLFNKAYKSLEIKKEQYLEIVDIDKKKNIIHLRNGKKIMKWNPQKLATNRDGITQNFQKNKIEINKGDRIIFTKNSKENPQIINSMAAIIKSISDEKIKVELANGKIETFNTKDNQLKHIDHGYATTVHSAQGKTANNVIAVLESYREQLLSQKSFYVTISRARNNVTLIVDDKEKVADGVFRNTGVKVAALESQVGGGRGLERSF